MKQSMRSFKQKANDGNI